MKKMCVLVVLLILGVLLVGSLGAADQLEADKTAETFLGERERYEVRRRKVANPEGKNLVSNGSFELGTCNWELSLARSIWIPWALDLAGKEEIRWQIDKSTCHDGEASLLVQGMTDDQSSIGLLAFSPLFLSNHKSYALSFYAKGNGLTITVGGESFPLTRDWQRYSVIIKGEPAYYLRFNLAGTGKLWLDAVQIEEGSEVTVFSPAPTVELGLLTDRDDGIYYSGTRPAVYFHLHNGSKKTARGKVTFQVKNFYHDVVAKGDLPFVLGPGKKQELTKQLDLKNKGIFWTRAVLLEEGARKKDRELNFAILSPLDGKDTFFGASQWETGNAQKQFKIARDMGMSFFLPYGPFNYLVPKDWKTGIAKLGKEDVPYALRLARQYGLSLIGEIGGVPVWASPTEGRIGHYKDRGAWGLPAPNNITREVLSGWSDFIFTTVDRFKNSISYWEIWHEGNAESREDADAMVRFLKAASQAAKRANPDCIIIGHGFCHYDFVKQAELCFEQGGLQYLDVVSSHHHGRIASNQGVESLGEEFEKLKALMQKHGKEKPIWATENGRRGMNTFYENIPNAESAGYSAVGSEEEQADRLVKANIIAKAHGVERFATFIITGRVGVRPFPYGMTIGYCREPKAVIPAYNTLATLLSNTSFVEEIKGIKGVRCYIFKQRKDRYITSVWDKSEKNQNRKRALELCMPLDPGMIEAVNLMGNRVFPKLRGGESCLLLRGGSPVFLITEKNPSAFLKEAAAGEKVQ